MAQRDLLIRVVEALEQSGIDYMVTGSLASSFHGEPRSTHDIDLVIDLHPEHAAALADRFPPPAFHLDPEALARAIAQKNLACLLDVNEGDKVDFWMLTEEPFDRERFSRRRMESVFGRTLAVSSPEDTILQKLRWSAMSGGSERQLHDAQRIWEVQGSRLDLEYLRHWARRLDLSQALEEMMRPG
jgi:hypothetical protein